MTNSPCPSCGMHDDLHWYDCPASPLRSDLTEDQKREAMRVGRIQFASAGARSPSETNDNLIKLLYHHPLCPCASAFAQLPSVRAVCKCDGVTEEEFKAERARIGRIQFKSAAARRQK